MDECDCDEEFTPRPLDWFGIIAHVASFVDTVAEGVHDLAFNIAADIRSHANWRMDRSEFVTRVTDDIKRLG